MAFPRLQFILLSFLPKSNESDQVVETVADEDANLDEFFDAIFATPELEELLSETRENKIESIRMIYQEIDSILPYFTPYRKYMITGYIAEGFWTLKL
ncbi:MAG: hypothetical protein IPI31_10840 [Bacteroidetes bacterium]|nr:hypothetical protein [Bacteroidota bacterium]